MSKHDKSDCHIVAKAEEILAIAKYNEDAHIVVVTKEELRKAQPDVSEDVLDEAWEALKLFDLIEISDFYVEEVANARAMEKTGRLW